MYKIVEGDKATLWNDIIKEFENQDVYFTYEYFLVSLLLDEGKPLLFYYEDEFGKVAYPFIKRTIPAKETEIFYDISTPYGYGGPLISFSGNKEELLQRFRKEFNMYCKSNNIVSEFVRFHPCLQNQNGLKMDLNAAYIRNTISLDLVGVENLLMDLPGKTRNMIRKAKKNGVTIKKVNAKENLQQFVTIYYSTMERNDASDYYYFEEKYFQDLITLMDSNIQMFGAFFEGKMISATLIFNYGEFIHYHLSGALKEYLYLGANNLLLYKVAEWGAENEYRTFHLGGGYSGNDDSLYKFKKSFSKSDPLDFYVGKKIHSEELYQKLVQANGISEENGYFPLYRS